MKCKFIDVDCNCLPHQMPTDCNDECWVFWQAQNTKNVEEGNKLGLENKLLKEQRTHRNMQIKELKKIKNLAKQIVQEFNNPQHDKNPESYVNTTWEKIREIEKLL